MAEDTAVVPRGKIEALQVQSESGFTMAGIAEVFVASGFFKDVKQQSQAIVKILLGRELGLKEIQAMLSIHMVEGRPEVAAATLGALVKRSGKYTYRVTEHTVDACAIEFFEITKDGKESIGVSRFEMADAVRAGLAHKSNYKNYPKNMMFARAMSNGVKWYCLDAVGNIPVYTEGELSEVLPTSGEPGSPEKPDEYAGMEPQELSSAAVTPNASAGGVVESRPEPAESGSAATPSEAVSSQPEVTPAMSVEDPKVVFDLNGVGYATNGISKDQMLTLFKLGPEANKKLGRKGWDKSLLLDKFGITTRKDLTAEQAEQYIALLTDAIGVE